MTPTGEGLSEERCSEMINQSLMVAMPLLAKFVEAQLIGALAGRRG
ncbi:MAG: hypothetical protein ACXW27_08930 [Allosphingosinicella sp.]